MSDAAGLIERVGRGEFVDLHQEIIPVLKAAVRSQIALTEIIKEYRDHDTAGIDAIYQLASDALQSWWCESCKVEVYQVRCLHCGKSKQEKK